MWRILLRRLAGAPTSCSNCLIKSLTYDLNGFKSRINRHLLLTVDSFEKDLLDALIFLRFFFFVTSHFTMAVPPCLKWIPIKKQIHSF